MHEAVMMYEANQRQGTHRTLRRGEVAGSTKKLFRQKGTGNARVGTKRTNKRRGGGTAKGPKPRDYSYALPKQAFATATRMAILAKIRDNAAVVVDDFGLTAIKTKDMAGILKALNLRDVARPGSAAAGRGRDAEEAEEEEPESVDRDRQDRPDGVQVGPEPGRRAGAADFRLQCLRSAATKAARADQGALWRPFGEESEVRSQGSGVEMC